jgi:hypothetical protein
VTAWSWLAEHPWHVAIGYLAGMVVLAAACIHGAVDEPVPFRAVVCPFTLERLWVAEGWPRHRRLWRLFR